MLQVFHFVKVEVERWQLGRWVHHREWRLRWTMEGSSKGSVREALMQALALFQIHWQAVLVLDRAKGAAAARGTLSALTAHIPVAELLVAVRSALRVGR